MPCEYRLKRRVQFYETDMAGIVHFSWFFRYLEEAEHAMWRAAGLSIAGGSGIAGRERRDPGHGGRTGRPTGPVHAARESRNG